MLKNTILILLILCSTISAQKVKDGFIGYKWGTDFNTMKSLFELEILIDTGNATYYLTSIQQYEGVEIDNLSFMFYKNKFHGIFFELSEKSVIESMIKLIAEIYGKPDEHKLNNKGEDEYTWNNEKTLRTFTANQLTYKANFQMLSMYYVIERDYELKVKNNNKFKKPKEDSLQYFYSVERSKLNTYYTSIYSILDSSHRLENDDLYLFSIQKDLINITNSLDNLMYFFLISNFSESVTSKDIIFLSIRGIGLNLGSIKDGIKSIQNNLTNIKTQSMIKQGNELLKNLEKLYRDFYYSIPKNNKQIIDNIIENE